MRNPEIESKKDRHGVVEYALNGKVSESGATIGIVGSLKARRDDVRLVFVGAKFMFRGFFWIFRRVCGLKFGLWG